MRKKRLENYQSLYDLGKQIFIYQLIADGKPIKCAEPGCEVVRIQDLSIDHVNDDGKEHRKNTQEHLPMHRILYSDFLKYGCLPDEYELQLLCKQHNRTKLKSYTEVQEKKTIWNFSDQIEKIEATERSIWEFFNEEPS